MICSFFRLRKRMADIAIMPTCIVLVARSIIPISVCIPTIGRLMFLDATYRIIRKIEIRMEVTHGPTV